MVPSRSGIGKVLIVVDVVVAISGCAHYQPQPLSPDLTVIDFEARRLDDPGLKKFLEKNHVELPGDKDSWDFQKLPFVAFYYHPDLDLARAKWGVAEAGKITAGERPNPSVNFSPAYDTTTMPAWILGVSFDIPVETAGKRGHRISQAGHLSDAARLNIAATAWQVRSRLRERLLNLYVATEAEGLLGEQDATQAEVVRLLEQQFSLGNVPRIEVTQARIALNTTRLALDEARRQSAEARVGVADALGVPAGALDGIKVSFVGLDQLPVQIDLGKARRRAAISRADILSALSEYAATQAALQLEIARQYPDLHIGPGYQLDQGDNKWSLGLTLTLPLLNQNQGPIAEAEARRTLAAAQFIALQTRVIGEIDRSVTGYQAALRKSATAEALLADLRQRQESAQSMFEAGEADRLALAAAKLEFTTGALARLEAQGKAQQALGQIEDALQSPLVLPESIFLEPQKPPRARENGPDR